MSISGHRPQRLECKNPRRNAAVYHAKRLGFSRDWIVKMLFSDASVSVVEFDFVELLTVKGYGMLFIAKH